tara:strand:- start:458 stop:682 length:225 start_codon:yes stop_codon:yes gene_type:complete
MPVDRFNRELQVGDLVHWPGRFGPGLVLGIHKTRSRLLAGQSGHTAKIFWIKEGDILFQGTRWVVKLEVPSDNH